MSVITNKILFTASIPLHIRAFHLPYLQWFKNHGYEVHVACSGYEDLPFVDKYWDIPFERSPFSTKHFNAFRQLKKVIDKENFCLINCHTPMTSVLTRLASIKARKNGTKLLYTAHGFHFFKGASFINWLLFYPIELYLTKITDAIICINQEDFKLIQKKGSSNCAYYIIPGIGVNNSRFFKISTTQKNALRSKFNFKKDELLLIYAAEYIPRKNHKFIVNTVKKRPRIFKNTKILFAGKGELENSLKEMVNREGLENKIKFLGFRKDIDQIYQMCDVGISASKQEGLGLNLIEEMMCGLPIIATVDRGHKEVVDHKVNGFLYPQNDEKQFCKSVLILKNKPDVTKQFSINAVAKAQKFELSNSVRIMTKIYKKYLP